MKDFRKRTTINSLKYNKNEKKKKKKNTFYVAERVSVAIYLLDFFSSYLNKKFNHWFCCCWPCSNALLYKIEFLDNSCKILLFFLLFLFLFIFNDQMIFNGCYLVFVAFWLKNNFVDLYEIALYHTKWFNHVCVCVSVRVYNVAVSFWNYFFISTVKSNHVTDSHYMAT